MGMGKKTRLKIILFLIFSFSTSVYSFDFSDTSSEFRIAVLEAELINVSQNLQHLSFLFTDLIHEFLSPIDEHVLTDAEIEAKQKFLYLQKHNDITKTISSKKKSLDSEFFKRQRNEATERNLEIEIFNLKNEIRLLDKYNYNEISVLKKLPIFFVYENENDKKVFSYNSNIETKIQFADRTNADYILFPKIEQIGSILHLSIDLFSKIESKFIYSNTSAGNINDFNEISEAFYKSLVSLITGRLWTSLTISADPITSSIYLNNEKVGAGILSLPLLTPGVYEITIENPGYFTDIIEVNLEAHEHKDLNFILKKDFAPPVLINTFPANADVFLSSKWVGQTPFVILSPGEGEHFMLRKPGYLDYSGFIDSQVLAQKNFIFLNFIESASTQRLKKKRDEFYSMIAMLSFSLPVTLIAGGFVDNFKDPNASFPNLTNREQYAAYYASQAALVSGIILNVVMGVNMIVESIDYVKYADIM